MVPLGEFGSASETEVVIALLRSNGIPVVHGGRYNPRAPKEILVPQERLEEAKLLIADARGAAPASAGVGERMEEPRSLVTAVTWIFAIGIALVAIVAALSAYIRAMFRR